MRQNGGKKGYPLEEASSSLRAISRGYSMKLPLSCFQNHLNLEVALEMGEVFAFFGDDMAAGMGLLSSSLLNWRVIRVYMGGYLLDLFDGGVDQLGLLDEGDLLDFLVFVLLLEVSFEGRVLLLFAVESKGEEGLLHFELPVTIQRNAFNSQLEF